MNQVLVLCDDFWHPGEIIERGLALLQGEFEFVVVRDAKDTLYPAYLKRFPVIVGCKGNSINGANQNPWFEEGVTEVGPAEFRAYVEEGGGYVSVHAGNTFGPNRCPAFADFIGNSFVTHPARCDMEVQIKEVHPVTQGVEPFTLRDEHYQLDHIAPDAKILFTTHSQTGGDQVGGYVREMGKGRLCALTPGHLYSVWENPMFQKLLCNSIRWAGRLGL